MDIDSNTIISLGSNVPDAEILIEEAFHFIERLGHISDDSACYHSKAEGLTAPAYLNRLIKCHFKSSIEDIQHECKQYETSVRNKYAHMLPLVAIDIDIVESGGKVLRPRDAVSGYYKTGKELLAEI